MKNFSALKPIRLEEGVAIRPVGEVDLRLLGVGHHLNISGKYWFLNPLNEKFPFSRTDWWVCEVRLPNTRDSTEAHNEIHRLFEYLQFGLRAFKEGNLSFALALIGPMEEFGRTGLGYNSTMHRFRYAKDNYSLSTKEAKDFVRFWKEFRNLMKNDTHYLQVPVRRLVPSGLRKDRE
ncbi:MAG: hypothetical protein H0V35_13180, partial [Nitrospira sp.]|nr:hypothetical protein [Nitrospira sp.]